MTIQQIGSSSIRQERVNKIICGCRARSIEFALEFLLVMMITTMIERNGVKDYTSKIIDNQTYHVQKNSRIFIIRYNHLHFFYTIVYHYIKALIICSLSDYWHLLSATSLLMQSRLDPSSSCLRLSNEFNLYVA